MFPVFLLFLIAGASAVKLECTLYSTRYDPLNCDFSNTTIPKGEAIEYVALDASVKKLSFTNCNMTVMPANLFVNFSKIEELSFSSSSLTQLLPVNFKNSTKLSTISVYKSNVRLLRNFVFRNAPLLKNVQLNDNKLKVISVNAFQKLSQLKYLRLGSNFLKKLPLAVFTPLAKLTSLNLQSNNLTVIPKGLFKSNLVLSTLMLNDNQITQIEEGAFENNAALGSLDFTNNRLVTTSPLNNGQYLTFNNNQLKKFFISTQPRNVYLSFNEIENFTCSSNVSNVRKFKANNNQLNSLNCIKIMDNLMELDLSFNKITQLTKTTFAKLKELYNLNLADNFIKKFNPQFLAPLTQLITLRVDKFTTYKNLETLFVKLPAIGLSTKTWSCNYVQNVTRALNSQKLLIDFNNFDTYRPSFEGYTCLLNMTTLNQIKKKIGIWDMIRM